MEQLQATPRTWQTWEVPLYFPRLRFDGSVLHLQTGRRALAADVADGLAWYRDEWSRRDDAPGLPLPS